MSAATLALVVAFGDEGRACLVYDSPQGRRTEVARLHTLSLAMMEAAQEVLKRATLCWLQSGAYPTGPNLVVGVNKLAAQGGDVRVTMQQLAQIMQGGEVSPRGLGRQGWRT